MSISLDRGEILGMAGESGSGKSTLAYAIARLLRPPAVVPQGQLLYYPRQEAQIARQHARKNGDSTPQPIDILQLTPAQLRAFRWRELSIVFQSAMNALNPVLTIGTQIMDVLHTHRPAMKQHELQERAVELLRLVGIASDRIRSYPHELSEVCANVR